MNQWDPIGTSVVGHAGINIAGIRSDPQYICSSLLKTLWDNETSRISPSIYTNCPPNSYQLWFHRSTSFWIVLNRSAFYLVLTTSCQFVSILVGLYQIVLHSYQFVTILTGPHIPTASLYIVSTPCQFLLVCMSSLHFLFYRIESHQESNTDQWEYTTNW